MWDVITYNGTLDKSMASLSCAILGAVARRFTMVLRGTIHTNYVVFIGHRRGQPIQQPMKTKSFMYCPT